MPKFYLNIAVDAPLYGLFDYLPTASSTRSEYAIGQRVTVPFGRMEKTGVITSISSETQLKDKQLKPILQQLDKTPLLSSHDISLYKWVADYYHHPIGEVVAQALPKKIRSDPSPAIKKEKTYSLSKTGLSLQASDLKRSPKQTVLWQLFTEANTPMQHQHFAHLDWDWRAPLKSMLKKEWVTLSHEHAVSEHRIIEPDFKPNRTQQAAIDTVADATGTFKTFLLDGVTGSGKTEVYLQLIKRVIAADQQVLILLPEITLTPQIASRFRQRLATRMVISHSGLNDTQRAQAWLQFSQGFAHLLLGTRSAVFTPMKRPGLIILDEEHDTSFKQQEGFRYSARDVAIMRAREYNIPIVLGSATPSLESLYNVQQKRFQHLLLPERTAGATHPDIRLVDCRNQTLDNHLSKALITAVTKTLEREEQVILFVNRRGFAPVLMCHGCGWIGQCRRCDSRMVIHKNSRSLKCHHCGAEHPVPSTCPSCQQPELFPLGLGTERIEDVLTKYFPTTPITRIDRDSTRQKDAMQTVIENVHKGGAHILVGTQMLAKGHHFPNVTLVGMVDIDAGLFSCDFRASERMSQLITQVAGRAGREEKRGRVLIQTHHPDHPLLNTLITQGYSHFAQQALQERQQADLPPYHYQALLRVNAMNEQTVLAFLSDAKHLIKQIKAPHISIFGPVPAPMLKRAGRYRYQLLLQAPQRKPLHQFLTPLLAGINKLKSSRKVRWSIDVDPVDLY
ncbi:MAG: primosomal protein N' [Piscirickettsiaceae bacterium]|nr:MAG: primosomal protein N' [Piscirickettsiaceae bacterium]